MKLCPTQNEEMVQIGKLCFGSIYIYREHLRIDIIQHASWNPNKDPNPPIFDLILSDFIGPNVKKNVIHYLRKIKAE